MITGVVDNNLEVTIPIRIQDAGGRIHQLSAVIDTGYDGFLTLTAVLAATFGLPLVTTTVAHLADGSVQVLPVHGATVDWDGQSRAIEVDVTDTKPLVGRGLLARHELRVEMVPGGTVTLEAIP
jgi:clan AA aspartic protease